MSDLPGNVDAAQGFDRSCDYYRVLGTRPGYYYQPGEAEIMASGRGLVGAEEPLFEFDPLMDIGRWLTLGGQVRRLRVPEDAVVRRNTPMSQGGCYRWSADRVVLLEILELPALMRAYDVAGICAGLVHISDYEFPPEFRFPAKVGSIMLDDCLACAPLDFPDRLERLELWDCALAVGRLPTALEFFGARGTMFVGLAGPPTGAALVAVSDDCSFG